MTPKLSPLALAIVLAACASPTGPRAAAPDALDGRWLGALAFPGDSTPARAELALREPDGGVTGSALFTLTVPDYSTLATCSVSGSRTTAGTELELTCGGETLRYTAQRTAPDTLVGTLSRLTGSRGSARLRLTRSAQ
jgi:hypothetical protein